MAELIDRKEDVIAADRLKLVNALSEQRGKLGVEMARVRAEAQAELRAGQNAERAKLAELEKGKSALQMEVHFLRSELEQIKVEAARAIAAQEEVRVGG